MNEARIAIYAKIKIEGLVYNSQHIEQPICKSVDRDFKVGKSASYMDMDMDMDMDAKRPMDSEILRKQIKI